MPTSNAEAWYCEHIATGSWPFILLVVPLIGAYLYGQNKKKLGWILIAVWATLQISFSYANNMLVNCGEEPAVSTEAAPQQ
jgi:hypothetical protein